VFADHRGSKLTSEMQSDIGLVIIIGDDLELTKGIGIQHVHSRNSGTLPEVTPEVVSDATYDLFRPLAEECDGVVPSFVPVLVEGLPMCAKDSFSLSSRSPSANSVIVAIERLRK
jgi:hypothetical protein